MKPSKTMTTAAVCALTAIAPSLAQAAEAVILSENFNDIGTLCGWVQVNNSVPPDQPWFQGNPGVFGAQAGPADAYVAANYLSAELGTGAIDNWLITPELTLGEASQLSFYTRTQSVSGHNDMLEVRFSPGSGTATSGFTTLLTTVGGRFEYPGSWQQFTTDLALPGSGRFAFHYVGDAAVANYIGIDTVTVSAVPEQPEYVLLGLGLAAVSLLLPKSRA